LRLKWKCLYFFVRFNSNLDWVQLLVCAFQSFLILILAFIQKELDKLLFSKQIIVYRLNSYFTDKAICDIKEVTLIVNCVISSLHRNKMFIDDKKCCFWIFRCYFCELRCKNSIPRIQTFWKWVKSQNMNQKYWPWPLPKSTCDKVIRCSS